MTTTPEETDRGTRTDISNRLTHHQHEQYREIFEEYLREFNIPGDIIWPASHFMPGFNAEVMQRETEYWFISPTKRRKKDFRIPDPTPKQLELLRRCYNFHSVVLADDPSTRTAAETMRDYFTHLLKEKHADYSPNGEFDEISKKLMDITGISFI